MNIPMTPLKLWACAACVVLVRRATWWTTLCWTSFNLANRTTHRSLNRWRQTSSGCCSKISRRINAATALQRLNWHTTSPWNILEW